MKNVLILGANGGIARCAIDLFLEQTDARLTLYLHNSRRLKHLEQTRARVVEGDVLDPARLKQAMPGQDVVYANLAGDLGGFLGMPWCADGRPRPGRDALANYPRLRDIVATPGHSSTRATGPGPGP